MDLEMNIISFDEIMDVKSEFSEDIPDAVLELMNKPFPQTDHIYHELLDPKYINEDDGIQDMPVYPLELNTNPEPFPDDAEELKWDDTEPSFVKEII